MLARAAPRCFRESPLLAHAFSDGAAAGRAGVAAEQNPWLEKGPGFPVEAYGRAEVEHAVSPNGRTLCGAALRRPSVFQLFDARAPFACKRCIRAVEAERRRLETRWEQGRVSQHPKRG